MAATGPTSISSADKRYYRVHFRVRAEKCGFGRVVGLSGNCDALGYFDPRRAIHLITTPESYPIWSTASPITVPAGEPLEYKFCLFEGGVFKSFENIATPHVIFPESIETVVENVFNTAELLDNVASLEDHSLLSSTTEANPLLPQQSGESGNFGVQGSLYLVCYHLPVFVERTGSFPSFNITWNDSIIAKTDGGVANRIRTHWVGTISVPGTPMTEGEKSELVGQLLMMNCVPIFLDSKITDAAYLGYCKQVLWPVFHNVDQLDCQTSLLGQSGAEDDNDSFRWSYAKSQTHWWDAYCRVNQAFSMIIVPRLHPHDVIWVHDYHLMLLPGMLRPIAQPEVRIIFYLHIPFPTSQVILLNCGLFYMIINLGALLIFNFAFDFYTFRSFAHCHARLI